MEVSTAPQAASTGFDFLSILMIGGAVILIVLALLGLLIYFWPMIVGWYKFRDREKYSLNFVLLQITVPRANEIKIDAAEQFISALYSVKTSGGMFGSFFEFLRPQPHLTFEIIALPESIRFFVACHKKYQDLVEKQINGA